MHTVVLRICGPFAGYLAFFGRIRVTAQKRTLISTTYRIFTLPIHPIFVFKFVFHPSCQSKPKHTCVGELSKGHEPCANLCSFRVCKRHDLGARFKGSPMRKTPDRTTSCLSLLPYQTLDPKPWLGQKLKHAAYGLPLASKTQRGFLQIIT